MEGHRVYEDVTCLAWVVRVCDHHLAWVEEILEAFVGALGSPF